MALPSERLLKPGRYGPFTQFYLTILGMCLLFLMQAVYAWSARSVALNSDSVNALLQGAAIAHGNVLLRNWTLSNVSFYTTDLLYYGLLVLIGGFHVSLLRIGPSLIYTLIVALAMLLASSGRESSRLRMGVVLLLIGFPVEDLATTVFSPMDHTDTLLLVMSAFIVLGLRDKLKWTAYVFVLGLLTFASIGDSLTWFIGCLPIILASLFGRKWLLAAVSALSVALGYLIAVNLHGFKLYPTYFRFSSLSAVPHHISYAIHGLLSLTGADFFAQRVDFQSLLSLLHIGGTVVMVYIAYLAVRRWRTLDYLSRILILSMVFNMSAFLFSSFPVGNDSDRYLLAFTTFGVILVARQLEWLTAIGRVPRQLRNAGTVFLVLVYGGSFFAFPTAHPNQTDFDVVTFLEQHNLTNGYGSYWSANILTALSGGRIHTSPTYVTGGNSISEYDWESNKAWYSYSANFVVFDTRTGFNEQSVVKTFGRPNQRFIVGPDEILVWNQNITPRLQHVPLQGGIAWG